MTIKLGIIIADRYHILELIGEGGMAFVYKAHDLKIESGSEAEGDYFVAVKTLRTDKLIQESKERTIRRFVAEARNTARLKHPNIVQVSDTGTFEDIPYMVMEYLPGDPLNERK